MRVWFWDWRWWYVVAVIEAWHKKVPNLKGNCPARVSVVITGVDINAVIKDIRERSGYKNKLFWAAQLKYDIDPDGPVALVLKDVEKMREKNEAK